MDKGHGTLSGKECEGPRGFLSPWGQLSQVLQERPGRARWPRPRLHAPQGSGGPGAPPLGETEQQAVGWGEHLFPGKEPLSSFQEEVTPSNPRLGEGSCLAERRWSRPEACCRVVRVITRCRCVSSCAPGLC